MPLYVLPHFTNPLVSCMFLAVFTIRYEYGTCFHASYSKLGSKLTLHTLDTHILPYDLFLDN